MTNIVFSDNLSSQELQAMDNADWLSILVNDFASKRIQSAKIVAHMAKDRLGSGDFDRFQKSIEYNLEMFRTNSWVLKCSASDYQVSPKELLSRANDLANELNA